MLWVIGGVGATHGRYVARVPVGRIRGGMRQVIDRWPLPIALIALAITLGCVRAQPPTDTGDPETPTAPSSPGSPAPPTSPVTPARLAYDPDMKPLFLSDCVSCHGGLRVDGKYRMTTYEEVLKDVRPDNASSKLVTMTQPNGKLQRQHQQPRVESRDGVSMAVLVDRAGNIRFTYNGYTEKTVQSYRHEIATLLLEP